MSVVAVVVSEAGCNFLTEIICFMSQNIQLDTCPEMEYS